MGQVATEYRCGRGRGRGEAIPSGTPFGRLTVDSGPFREPPPARAVLFYWCKCSCGQMVKVSRSNLVTGNTTSCGCWGREANVTHGDSYTRLYRIRAKMLDRCYNTKHKQFADYGGRGIQACQLWRYDYTAFRDWAIAHGYRDDLELDRIDNDGGYWPGNCRWATRRQQSRNKRTNNLILAFGETKCIYDWAADPRCAVRAPSIYQRLRKGWTPESAISTPAFQNGQLAS